MSSVRPALVVAALVAAAAALVLAGGIQPAQAGADCAVADTQNTVRIRADPGDGLVTGGAHLNGTAGYVWFTEIPRKTPLVLVAPDGTTVGPRETIFDDIVFGDVPLCKTGLWTLLDLGEGEVVATFRTASDPGGPLDRKTVAIDEPARTQTTRSYEAGSFDHAYAVYTGPTRVYGYSPTKVEAAEVSAGWSWDPTEDSEDLDTFRFTLLAEGQDRTVISTVETNGGSGTLTAAVGWSSPDVVDVFMMGRGYKEGQYWSGSSAGVYVSVLPGSGPPT